MVSGQNDTVVAHDQMWTYGGAERVALQMGVALDAPVYTTYAGETARSAADDLDVDLVTFAQKKYDGLGRWRQFEGFKSAALTLDWQTAPLEEFELVVSAHMFSRHYRTLDHQYMINYCHSPPRWLNDLQRYRLAELPGPVRTGAKLYMTLMDVFDARSTDRVDAFIANSEVIRERIRRYYRRDATVIYPPINTSTIQSGRSNGDFYLMMGRVVESKRPMTAVQAFDGIDETLRIAGGSDNEPILGTSTYDEVVAAAAEATGVDTLGYVSSERKRELLSTAKAVVYIPIREDFGMVPIEALAAGTPVIAANEGFPAIAIEDGKTGVVVEPTIAGIRRGVERIETINFDRDQLAEAARRYSTDRFNKRITEAVERFCSDPDAYRLRDEPLADE